MKEPIEELFKQSLEGHEMPYNAGAWEAMNTRLNGAEATAASSTSSLKYFIGAAAIGLVAVGTYFAFNHYRSLNNEHLEKGIQQEIPQQHIDQTQEIKQSIQSNTSSPKNEEIASPVISETTSPGNAVVNQQTQSASSSSSLDNPFLSGLEGLGSGSSHKENSGETSDVQNNSSAPLLSTPEHFPTLNDICLGEQIRIENENKEDLYLISPSGNELSISALSALTITGHAEGEYELGYFKKGQFISKKSFTVHPLPVADFTFDRINKFDENTGLPITYLETNSIENSILWKAENQSAKGRFAEFHFYKKGNHTVELTVSNSTCSSTSEKDIFIEEDYNLLAVTGFSPDDPNEKKRTFMPYALTKRDNVQFDLIIIDARDGGVVFETSDSRDAWDGVDRRTGSPAASGNTYIWKVLIHNPETNEPSEYKGMITRV